MIRHALLVAFALASSVAVAAAEESKSFRYEKLGETLARVDAAKAYDRLSVVLQVADASGAIKPSDIVFTIEAAAGTIIVTPEADGRVALPYSAELAAENPMMRASVPAGTGLSLELSVDARLADPQNFTYAELAEVAAQFDALIEAEAGMMSLFAPSMTGVSVACGADCSAQIDGGETLHPGENGEIPIPLDDGRAASGTVIALSHAPSRVKIEAE